MEECLEESIAATMALSRIVVAVVENAFRIHHFQAMRAVRAILGTWRLRGRIFEKDQVPLRFFPLKRGSTNKISEENLFHHHWHQRSFLDAL